MSAKSTEGASVIECLHHLWPDFQLTYNNQMNPTSEVAIKFYHRFICGQLQIEIEDIQRTLIEHASCPAAFTDILNIYALYMCTATVIKKLGLIELIETFGLTDLLSPTRKKFKMSLILLSNCVIYVTGLQELMEEVKHNVMEALQGTKDIHNQIELIKEQINQAVVLHVKNIQKKEDLRKRNDALLKKIESAQQIYEPIRENIESQKKEISEIQDEYEIIESKLNDLQLLEEKFKNQIINDIPSITLEKERLIKNKCELVTESEDNKKMMEKTMHSISIYKENFNDIEQFVQTKPLEKLLDKYEILDKYNQDIEIYQNELKKFDEIDQHDLNHLNTIELENKSIENKIEEATLNHEKVIGNYEEQIRLLEGYIQEEENKKQEANKLSEELDKEMKEIEECSRLYELQIEKQNNYYNQKYKMILELKGQLDNKVLSCIEMVENKIKK